METAFLALVISAAIICVWVFLLELVTPSAMKHGGLIAGFVFGFGSALTLVVSLYATLAILIPSLRP